MTHCRIPISAVGVVGAVDIGEEQCVEASPFEQLCQSNPPLQIPVAARGFIERMFPHALDLMIRGALDEPVQNQVVGHTRNLAQRLSAHSCPSPPFGYVKMAFGRNAETIQFGASTISLMRRSTTTEQRM